MKYHKILKLIADKENVTVKEIEKEMEAALKAANINCSPQQFIKSITQKVILQSK